jgi:site-specific DNA recombinase
MRLGTDCHEPVRAVIYARYSSGNQSDVSIEDQIEVCRREISRQGWTLARTYEDRAMSGASRHRPGFEELVRDAEAARFDVIVCEALDRLGRNFSDLAALFDPLDFLKIRIHTLATGESRPCISAFLGRCRSSSLKDLREKTWRGQLGRVRKGRFAGGLAFGY